MSNSNKKRARWKQAQKNEFQFYEKIKKKERFSRGYKYIPDAIDYKFERWGFKTFDSKAILEVGCNVFGPLHYIQGAEAFKVGIDPLLGTLYEEVADKEISYLRSVGERLPFSSGAFDVVVCHNVLDHVNDPQKVLEEIHRVLRTQGIFLLCVNTHPGFVRAFKPLLSKLDKEHPYHFGSNEVQSVVESNRFRVDKLEIIKGFDIPEPKSNLLKRLLKASKFKPL